MIVYTDKHRIPFQIDEADAFAVSRYSWQIDNHGYPSTTIGKWPTTKRPLRLHQFLLGRAPDGKEWDHEDRDRRNNVRSNIRAVDDTVSARNTGRRRDNTSGVRGVSRRKDCDRWSATIKVAGRSKYIGTFTTLEAACAARTTAERDLWGDAPR
jgi:hypothetical protein